MHMILALHWPTRYIICILKQSRVSLKYVSLVSHFLCTTQHYSYLIIEIPFFHLMSAKVTFGNVNSHSEPVPHVSLRTEERMEDPVPVYTPTGPVSLATTEGGLVKQRHGRAAGGSSVDPEDAAPDHSAVDTGR